MKRSRQRIDPLAAMATANPVDSVQLTAEIGKSEIDEALARAVALGRSPSDRVSVPAGDEVALRTGQRRVRTLSLGLAAVALLAAVVLATGWLGNTGRGQPDFAAAAIRVAEANPRPLVTAPGWEIVRADEFEAESGELIFSDGSRHLEVHWYPARLYGTYLRDRASVSPPQSGTLVGARTTTVEYSPEEFATMLAPQGSVFIEVRGRLGSRPAYEEILHSLRRVSVEAWLSAMPPSTVRPQARAETVERMLRGIPIPPAFDAAILEDEGSISNHSSLAVEVGNAVACAWVQRWIAAQVAGDAVAAQEAVVAMEGSPAWPIVRRTEVPWFSNYTIVARQLRAGRLARGPAGYEEISGRLYARGPAWKLALGCDGTYRREVENLPR